MRFTAQVQILNRLVPKQDFKMLPTGASINPFGDLHRFLLSIKNDNPPNLTVDLSSGRDAQQRFIGNCAVLLEALGAQAVEVQLRLSDDGVELLELLDRLQGETDGYRFVSLTRDHEAALEKIAALEESSANAEQEMQQQQAEAAARAEQARAQAMAYERDLGFLRAELGNERFDEIMGRRPQNSEGSL